MKYWKFGKLDWKVSSMGLGVMSLPEIESGIDENKSIEIIRKAIDEGINLIDTGDRCFISRYEKTASIINKALKEGYREKVRISVGLPVSSLSSENNFYTYLNEDLKRFNTDKIDYYYLDDIDRITWPMVQEKNLLECLDTAISDGRIGNIGFYFHDHFRYLKNIVEGYDKWTFCKFRYSYMDSDHHPGTSGVKYAAEKGLAVVIDKPFLSGRLIREIPESVLKVWNEANTSPQRSLAEWGLLWILNHAEVSCVVSDMGTIEEVQENTAIVEKSCHDCLFVRELLLINQISESYRALKAVPCTTCRACMPCPAGVDVPRIFELYNEAAMFGNRDIPSVVYRMEGHSIELCNSCGKCLKGCGRKILIPEILKNINIYFNFDKNK